MMGYLLVHVVDERVVCITVEVVLVDMLSIFKYVLFMSFSISLLQTPGTSSRRLYWSLSLTMRPVV